MALPFTSIVLNSDKSWTFTWAPTSAVYYRVVLWGVELARGTFTSFNFDRNEYRKYPPPLEVVETVIEEVETEDDVLEVEVAELAVSEQHSPYFVIQWYQDLTADAYLVEQYVEGEWRTVRRVNETGLWVYTYTSQVLEDDTTYHLRVTAEGELGDKSDPVSFTKFVVTPPRPPDPDITVTYAAGNIQIADA